MGLGKTIQGVASMSMYFNEWPLLVLCPSGARYHWENELKQWLGVNSSVNRTKEDHEEKGSIANEKLLEEWQIHVLTSSKSEVLPDSDTKVVICSYGLAPTLIDSDRIYPGQFRCAIVDESHMLKNKSSKRTSTLLPVLCAMDRCVLLSGTPALARPLELWPQLAILRTELYGWGEDEQSFVDKYVKNGNVSTSAELHTLLTGTVMIRRLKNEILKTLPQKNREKAELHVLSQQKHRDEFTSLMMQLRQSKGTLGNLARIHHAEVSQDEVANNDEFRLTSETSYNTSIRQSDEDVNAMAAMQATTNDNRKGAMASLNLEAERMMSDGRNRIRHSIEMQAMLLLPEERERVMMQMEGQLRNDVENYYNDKMHQIKVRDSEQYPSAGSEQDEACKRTSLLSRLYGLTGEVKIPLVVDMLNRWLADPTKGKICIFAHHISVLDSIRDGACLSNETNATRKFIRIDGSTLPRQRQEQITAFQTDPSIRVALLGITAAGVAVTLTASSTVWFAELFWTPAIMIQAEDRVHRMYGKIYC
jgi:SNF2 family DNA or RNA helicase